MWSILFTLSPGSVILFIIFICMIYFGIQLLLDPTMVLQRSIDLIVFALLFVLCLFYLQTNSTVDELFRLESIQKGISFSLVQLDTLNALYFFLMGLILIYAFTFIFSLSSAVVPVSFSIVRDLFWFFFLLCSINEIMKRGFKYSLFANLNKLVLQGSMTPEEEEAAKKKLEEEELKKSLHNDRGEVFHIGNQLYSYKEADEICRLVNDSKLATREEMIKAQKQGANWEGSYGWCTDQQAYTISKEKGLEGGRVKNGDLLLGVNCIGKKPSITDRDRALMNLIRAESKGLDIMSQIKFLFAELNPDAFMTVRPFNFDQWSSEDVTSTLTASEDKEKRIEQRFKDIQTQIKDKTGN